jgi:hypothetical protein
MLKDPDWARLRAIEAAAGAAPSGAAQENRLEELRAIVNALEARHGRQPVLVAALAALDATPERGRLLFEEAYELAVKQSDDACALSCALALARLHVDGSDLVRARQWLEHARKVSRGAAAEDLEELDALSVMLPRQPLHLDLLD